MPQKATCYLSYSWSDQILSFLLRLKSDIEKQSQNRIKVILDRRNFGVGEDFKQKEKHIIESDLILPFFTPEYKRKVDTPIEDSGCYREYEYILKKRKKGSRYIYPILFKGDKEKAIPRDFRDITCNIDISTIIYHKKNKNNSEISIDRKHLNKYRAFINDIINKAKSNYAISGIRYLDNDEKYKALLKNTAADGTLKSSCMIKTPAYSEILNQTSYFVIGRKGSGKTTLLETVEKLDHQKFTDKFKILCPINAEDIDINFVYTCVDSLYKDNTFIQTTKLTDLYWEIFFIIQTMFIIGLEFENGRLNKDYRYKVFKKVAIFLKHNLGSNNNAKLTDNSIKSQLPTFVSEIMEKYFSEHILDKANESAFMTSIKTNLNAQNIISTFIGEDLFEKFALCFGACEKKTLISLDGFDTHSEDFRRITRTLLNTNPSEYEKRNEFECLFYRSLCNVVLKFKRKDYNNIIDTIADRIDFCIVLPQDRYDQIQTVDRDIAKVNCCGLFWDAYDLLRMLVLRLEEYYEIEPIANQNMLQRFQRIINEKLPQIPNTVKVFSGDRWYDFELFNYILRFSFWRPRDILLNFISLLQLVENSKELDLEIDDKMIKEALSQSASNIIDKEFIAEYQNVFYNLKGVLNCFRGKNILYTISDFFDIIESIKFDASFSYDCTESKNKILILYQLGVIGLIFNKDTIADRGYTHHICFNFNEGLDPIYNSIMDCDTIENDASIIINPLFCKKFHIAINTKELIGNYDWAYIKKLAAEKTQKRRF